MRGSKNVFKDLHRSVSRKIKGSRNRAKAKQKLGRFYEKIKNVRQDFLHKATTAISKNHAVVVVEDLKVQNLTASGKGKRGLNKAILSLGWGEFRRQLEYKLAWNGGRLVVVPPAYTSQTCPVETCRHVSPDNRKSQELFSCVKCGFTANADYVGALNTKRAGHARLACSPSEEGESQSRGSTAEPCGVAGTDLVLA
ncbi:MAG: transposase [Nitrospirae bacterium]|nr:transposase [Nitrospirota bacterium]MCL5285851.1 transposase [Nitrospirota bacterium]